MITEYPHPVERVVAVVVPAAVTAAVLAEVVLNKPNPFITIAGLVLCIVVVFKSIIEFANAVLYVVMCIGLAVGMTALMSFHGVDVDLMTLIVFGYLLTVGQRVALPQRVNLLVEIGVMSASACAVLAVCWQWPMATWLLIAGAGAYMLRWFTTNLPDSSGQPEVMVTLRWFGVAVYAAEMVTPMLLVLRAQWWTWLTTGVVVVGGLAVMTHKVNRLVVHELAVAQLLDAPPPVNTFGMALFRLMIVGVAVELLGGLCAPVLAAPIPAAVLVVISTYVAERTRYYLICPIVGGACFACSPVLTVIAVWVMTRVLVDYDVRRVAENGLHA